MDVIPLHDFSGLTDELFLLLSEILVLLIVRLEHQLLLLVLPALRVRQPVRIAQGERDIVFEGSRREVIGVSESAQGTLVLISDVRALDLLRQV